MDVARECEAIRDPRIRRTRHALQEALARLLDSRSFEQLSVIEISEAANVNRATFYDHYADKFALLEALVASRFFGLLEARKIRYAGTCPAALKALILAVCDFLASAGGLQRNAHGTSFQPLIESTVVSLIRKIVIEGPEEASQPPALASTCASWAIYGAVKEWATMSDRLPPEEISSTILHLVAPILGLQASLEEHGQPPDPVYLLKSKEDL